MKTKEEILTAHLKNVPMSQTAIYKAMQEYADQEVKKVKKIKGVRKEPYDFSGDEEYRHNSNC